MDANIDIFEAIDRTCQQNIYCSPPYEVVEINKVTGDIGIDILDGRRNVIDYSFGAAIDYAAPYVHDEEEAFDSFPELHINVESVHDPLRHNKIMT